MLIIQTDTSVLTAKLTITVAAVDVFKSGSLAARHRFATVSATGPPS